MHALQQTVVLDAIVKASLILAATGLIATVLRRASAAARHMIWTLGLMGALIVPALAMALPRWEVPLVRLSTETVDAPPPAAIPAPAPPAIAHHRTPTTTNDAAASTGSADPTNGSACASELVDVAAADLVDRGAPDRRPHAGGTRRRAMDVSPHGARDRRALADAGARAGARSRPLARSLSPHRSGLHADGVGHPASVRADAGGRRQLAR